jgi:hypothetical protein
VGGPELGHAPRPSRHHYPDSTLHECHAPVRIEPVALATARLGRCIPDYVQYTQSVSAGDGSSLRSYEALAPEIVEFPGSRGSDMHP